MKALNKRFLFILAIIIFIISLILLLVCLNINYEKFINADMSSELILGKQIAKEGRLIFSKNWYYSTEIRVINNQIIYGLLFRITNNFRIVFSVSQIIIISIYLICLFVLLKSINYQKYFFVVGTLLLIPWFQTAYYDMILMYQFYIPHICFSFITVACFFYYQNKTPKITISLCLASILSILNSLEGPRAIIVLYIPLFIIIMIEYFKNKNNKLLIFGITILLFSGIGFCVNQFFFKKIFNVYSNYYTFSLTFSKLKNALWLSLEALGCSATDWKSNVIFSFTLIYIISYIYLLVKNYKKIDRKQFNLFLFWSFSFLGIFLMFCFATLWPEIRYFLPSTVFLVILFPYYLTLLKFTFKLKPLKNNNLSIFLIAGLKCIGFTAICAINYKILFNSSISPYKEIAEELSNRGLIKGYSKFWLANSITEISNGKIDMYSYADYKKGEGLHIYKWLQLKSHDDFMIKGRTFIIYYPNDINSELYTVALKYSKETKTFKTGYKIQFFEDITPLFR